MSKVVLKRKVYAKMLQWKEKYAPEYALFVSFTLPIGEVDQP